MNKLLTKAAKLLLGLSLAAGVGVAVSSQKSISVNAAIDTSTNEEAYEVTFTKGASDSVTTAPTIASGGTYATIGTTNKAYARTKGLHLGSSSATGSQVINLTSGTGKGQIQATYLSVYAIQVDSGKSLKTTVTYTDSTTTTNTTATGSSLAYIDIALTSSKTISSITFESVTASKGRVAIDSFKVYKAKTGKTLSSIAVKTAPTKTTYYEGQTFDPTGLVITGTYSDNSTEDVAYASNASDFSFTPSTSTALTTSNVSVSIGYGGKTTTQAITVNADVLNSISISGNMSTTSYTTANSWVTTGLAVTASYTGKGNIDVTSSSSFNFYKDSSMTLEVATPIDLGVGASQTIYVKATYSGVSNTTGYSQTVTVTKAPSVQSATINLVDITLNDSHSQDATDVSITKGAVTFAWTKVSGSTAANSYIGGYNSRTQTRIYTGHRLTISANSNVLKSVTFTGATGTSNGPNKMSSWTGGTLSTYDTTDGTAAVTANNNVTSLVCTPSANTYLFEAVVEYYAPDVAATGITINGQTSSSVSITPYQTTRLAASVLPLDATDRTFEWSLNPSGANAIITIDASGHVEPIAGKYGATIVTATSNDGGFTATCTVTVEHVSYHQAVYLPTSTSSVSTSGTLPDGETHTFACGSYQSGYAQITTNNPTATLTLSGYGGQKIRAILLKMHSNANAGTGSLSIVAGSDTIVSITTAPFSDESWNGEYTTDWVLIEPTFAHFDVSNNEDVVITVSATVNSLYLSEIRVQYEPSEVDTTAVDLAQMILDDITCNAQGTSAPSSSDWLVLEEFWNETVTSDGKQTLLDAVAVEHASPASDEEIIEAAMAKYDYIIGKYNKAQGLTSQYPDFINRNPSPIGNANIALSTIVGTENTNTIAIIVIISLVSVTAIGGYFFVKRREEN